MPADPAPATSHAGTRGLPGCCAARHPRPNGLRYLDYFLGLLAGSRLGTGAKLELITMISGFATSCPLR